MFVNDDGVWSLHACPFCPAILNILCICIWLIIPFCISIFRWLLFIFVKVLDCGRGYSINLDYCLWNCSCGLSFRPWSLVLILLSAAVWINDLSVSLWETLEHYSQISISQLVYSLYCACCHLNCFSIFFGWESPEFFWCVSVNDLD